MPGFIKPQLATVRSKAPKGEQRLHEIKYDGYRVQVHLNRGRKKVFTRNGLDWTKRFTEIAGALAISGEAIIDSEHRTVDGQQMFEHAAKLNWEGIVSKRAMRRIDPSAPRLG